MKVLLTSAGLETDTIKNFFLKILLKKPKEIKALFIPTAAIDVGAIDVLPKCMNDLLKCGIKEENITVYDLHKVMLLEKMKQFDVLYICGGNTAYLLERINEQGFNKVLKNYIENDGIVVGVSAGSIIMAQNLEHNLGLINCILNVHCKYGNTAGPLDILTSQEIRLTNNQAIYLTDIDCASIIE
jgi:dipeptidase E